MSALIAPLTLRIETLFTQAAAACDDVESGVLNPPLKFWLEQIHKDFRQRRLHILIIPANPECLPLLWAALPPDVLPSPLPEPGRWFLYSLVPESGPQPFWSDALHPHSATDRPIWQIHRYPPAAVPLPVSLHLLSDPGALLQSPVWLGELSGNMDLTVLIHPADTLLAASADSFRNLPGYAEAMIEWAPTAPPTETEDGLGLTHSLSPWFGEQWNQLLDPPRNEGYRLMAASRKLARLKRLLQYAVQRRQEQIKNWNSEAARRKKHQDECSKNQADLISYLEKLSEKSLQEIRADFLQSYRYYKTAMDEGDTSQGGVRTAHYCYPFNIEGLALGELDQDDLERKRNRRREPVFKNRLWHYLAEKFGNTEYKLSIPSGKLASVTQNTRNRLKKHLDKECRDFNQAIVQLQNTLQVSLQEHRLNATVQLPIINPEVVMDTLKNQPIRVNDDETLVIYGYGLRFREGRMLLGGGFYMIIMMLTRVFREEINEVFHLQATSNITSWLMVFLMVFSLAIYFPYAGRKYAVEAEKTIESALGKLRRKLRDAIQKFCKDAEEQKKQAWSTHLDCIKNQIKTECDRLRAGLALREPVVGSSELYITRKTEEWRQWTAPTAAFSRFNSEIDNPSLKADLQKLKLELQKR